MSYRDGDFHLVRQDGFDFHFFYPFKCWLDRETGRAVLAGDDSTDVWRLEPSFLGENFTDAFFNGDWRDLDEDIIGGNYMLVRMDSRVLPPRPEKNNYEQSVVLGETTAELSGIAPDFFYEGLLYSKIKVIVGEGLDDCWLLLPTVASEVPREFADGNRG